jgi:sarcosine oxidase gamma subunit
MAEFIAASATRPGARRIHGVTALSVRSLAGDTAAQRAVHKAGLPWVNLPGELAGADPIVAWRAPQELIVIGCKAGPLRALQHALAPGLHAAALAVDLSEAIAVIEMHGPALDEWLTHLVDASAVPREPGRVSRCRLADVPVMLLRLETDRLWLVVDRPLQRYISDWLAYAHDGAYADLP